MYRLLVLPLGCFGAMLLYAVYGALVIGHWPYYAHPDPTELPVRLLLSFAVWAVLIGGVSVVLLPAVYAAWRLALRLRRRPVPPHRAWVSLYAAGAVAWIIDAAAMFGKLPWPSVMSWILD